MIMKLPSWMLLFLFTPTFFLPFTRAEIKHICSNRTEVIQCPAGTSSISILKAEYGRKNRTVCNDDISWFIWCPMQSVKKHADRICNGKKDCYFTVKSQELSLEEEESCRFVRNKYLEIEYSCSGSPLTTTPKPITPTKAPEVLVPATTNNFQRICELDKGFIECGINQKIIITKIFWGRENSTSSTVCKTDWYPKEIGDQQCAQSSAMEKADLLNSIRQYCDNKENCNFLKPKWYLKHPCPGKELSKYLEITYDCMSPVIPTGRPMSVTICQGLTFEAFCTNGSVIEILDAWYGFDPNATEKCGANHTNRCGVDAVKSLSILCGNTRGCQISALDDRFPISSCSKDSGFIALTYQCIAYKGGRVPQVTKPPFTKPPTPNTTDMLTRTLSDGKATLLFCASASIYIQEVLYGNSDNNCVIDITKFIEHDCEGYTLCTLSASIGAYGDPKCPEGVTRRMELKYWCGVKAPTAAPPIFNVPDAAKSQAPSIGINDPNCGKPRIRTTRVISGVNAVPGRWPWQAEIYTSDFYHLCGCSLISSEWIASAAHCIQETDVTNTHKFFIVLGEFNRTKKEGTEFRYNVTQIVRHSLYGANGQVVHDYDFMLLKITPSADMTTHIQTVCVPDATETDDLYYQDCFLTGWGKPNNPGRTAYILQQAMLQPVNNSECNRKLANTLGEPSGVITENMLCANDRLNIGMSGCQGDSGGPFVCRRKDNNAWYLRGAVSWGSERCNIKDMYQVLAKVSRFRQLIDDTI